MCEGFFYKLRFKGSSIIKQNHRRPFIMAKEDKNCTQSTNDGRKTKQHHHLLEEYDIQNAEDI